MILPSRNLYSSSEDFRDRFLETITPGVIKRADFIQWDTIAKKNEKYKLLLDFFKQISGKTNKIYTVQIANGLMSADRPLDIIKTAFELLGHTGKVYVSDRDHIDFRHLGDQELTEELANYISNLLVELGICNILNLEINDYFTGVQVGLESHRRKNVGGEAFSVVVGNELKSLVERLNDKGYKVELTKEENIYFSDKKTSKQVDFCLHYMNQAIGIEANFYTASGSKPTEIKRSYGHVNNELKKVGVVLVWITDGIGYEDMKNSLKEARDIHKNTYNFNMMKESFEKDVITAFGLSE